MHNWSGNLDFKQREGEISTCGGFFVRFYCKSRRHWKTLWCSNSLLSNYGTAMKYPGVLGHMDTQTIEEVINGEGYQNQEKHTRQVIGVSTYCKECDFNPRPVVLIWTNNQIMLKKKI